MTAARQRLAAQLTQARGTANDRQLLVAVASAVEARLVPRHGAAVDVVQAGPGLQAGALVAALMGARKFAGILSLGFAGGLAPQLPPGTVLLPRHVRRGTTRVASADSEWHRRVLQRLADAGDCCVDDLLAHDALVHDPSQKARLHEATGAAAVDLETGPLAAIADRNALPFLALRVILDGAADALPEAAGEMLAPSGATRPAAMLLAMARSPVAFARLVSRYRLSARALRHALAAAWPALATPPRRPAREFNGGAGTSRAE